MSESLSESDVLEMFVDVGGITTGDHIVYASGLHGPKYVNKRAIYPYVDKVSSLCKEIARQFQNFDIDVVIAPATGGVLLSHWTAHHMMLLPSCEKTILGLFADKKKDGKTLTIASAFREHLKDVRVGVIDDIATTGGSLQQTVELVRECGGNVVVAAVLCNRGNVTADKVGNVPVFKALLNLDFRSYNPHSEEGCPNCKAGEFANEDLGDGEVWNADLLEALKLGMHL